MSMVHISMGPRAKEKLLGKKFGVRNNSQDRFLADSRE